MKRPYVFCHMMTSLDGKIMGNWFDAPEAEEAGEYFDNLTLGRVPEGYHMQGWFSGRVTSELAFTDYAKPVLDENEPPVPEGDYIIKMEKPMYYISIDTHGKLGWQENTITYSGVTARVLEVLTESASNAYRAMLRKLGIPYVIAGKDSLDIPLLMEKLHDEFGLETLMLGGGGTINWSFIRQGMCDELSVVMAPCADGSTQTPTLFMAKDGLSEDEPVSFELLDVKKLDCGALWLRYMVKNRR